MVVWRYETRHGSGRKFRWMPRLVSMPAISEPATWTTFEQALAVFEARQRHSAGSHMCSADDPFCGSMWMIAWMRKVICSGVGSAGTVSDLL